jgi:hypothetical protein
MKNYEIIQSNHHILRSRLLNQYYHGSWNE